MAKAMSNRETMLLCIQTDEEFHRLQGTEPCRDGQELKRLIATIPSAAAARPGAPPESKESNG